ncbi:MAG TPA: hypothetical protein VFL16_05840 [Steroidobacteraceae bacterium]|nr:hypothetical protein [Steroidobacteraceae bacterium]
MRRVPIRRILVVALLASACATATAGGFRLFYDDGYNDQYDSSAALFKRKNCRGGNDLASFSLDSKAIKRLKRKIRQVHFFKLPDRIDPNSDGETITICGPCGESRLTVETGFKSRTIEWECNCATRGDPDELAPLLKELREILYSAPAIAGLPESACYYY